MLCKMFSSSVCFLMISCKITVSPVTRTDMVSWDTGWNKKLVNTHYTTFLRSDPYTGRVLLSQNSAAAVDLISSVLPLSYRTAQGHTHSSPRVTFFIMELVGSRFLCDGWLRRSFPLKVFPPCSLLSLLWLTSLHRWLIYQCVRLVLFIPRPLPLQ